MSRVAHVRPLPAVLLRNALLRMTPPASALKRLEPVISTELEPSRRR
jgi:hypothetical protein